MNTYALRQKDQPLGWGSHRKGIIVRRLRNTDLEASLSQHISHTSKILVLVSPKDFFQAVPSVHSAETHKPGREREKSLREKNRREPLGSISALHDPQTQTRKSP